MATQVVVLGAGYAGAGAVQTFEEEMEDADVDAELTWISEHDYHLVLHEVHRCIRKPEVESKVTIPVDEIKSAETDFVRSRVTGVDTDERVVALEDGADVEYDYLLVAMGSATSFFGIEGLEEHSLTLKSLDDARQIHDQVTSAVEGASRNDPAQVIVGGAGLSGIQTAGEIAEFRDDHHAPIEIKLVEALDEVFPGNDPELQGALRKRLQQKDIEILTGEFVTKADEDTVYRGGGENEDPEELDYDVFIWTGGITGQEELAETTLDKDERSNRIFSETDLQTSDERVFAIGDSALIDQDDEEVAPPTAQAAWQAADVAGQNLARAVRGAPLKTWKHEDKGTLVSVGEKAVAHDVKFTSRVGIPLNTFGGPAAETLKKAVAARWIADITSVGRAASAWNDM